MRPTSAARSRDVLIGRCQVTAEMNTYNFTLILEGADVLAGETLDVLYEAGCGDAGFGRSNQVQTAEFDREAASFEEAVMSAIRDVESAVSGLRVARVEPDDLVTAAAIAQRTGRTRQSIAQLAAGTRGAGDFPTPVASVDAKTRLWRWSEVVRWFAEREDRASSTGPSIAEFVAALNGVLEARRHLARLARLPHDESAVAEIARLVRPQGER